MPIGLGLRNARQLSGTRAAASTEGQSGRQAQRPQAAADGVAGNRSRSASMPWSDSVTSDRIRAICPVTRSRRASRWEGSGSHSRTVMSVSVTSRTTTVGRLQVSAAKIE